MFSAALTFFSLLWGKVPGKDKLYALAIVALVIGFFGFRAWERHVGAQACRDSEAAAAAAARAEQKQIDGEAAKDNAATEARFHVLDAALQGLQGKRDAINLPAACVYPADLVRDINAARARP